MVMTRSQKLKMQGQENAEDTHGINFDEASQAWRANKYPVGNGEWRYREFATEGASQRVDTARPLEKENKMTHEQSAQSAQQLSSWRKLGNILFSILK